jgi:hypothetical protein
MKRSELGLATWCLSSWWCVLWIRNKLYLSDMLSSLVHPLQATGTADLLPLAGTRYSPLAIWQVKKGKGERGGSAAALKTKAPLATEFYVLCPA